MASKINEKSLKVQVCSGSRPRGAPGQPRDPQSIPKAIKSEPKVYTLVERGRRQGRSLQIRRASPGLAARRMRFPSATLTRDIRRDPPPQPAHHCRWPPAAQQLFFSSGKGLENSASLFSAKNCQIYQNGT